MKRDQAERFFGGGDGGSMSTLPTPQRVRRMQIEAIRCSGMVHSYNSVTRGILSSPCGRLGKDARDDGIGKHHAGRTLGAGVSDISGSSLPSLLDR